MPRSWTDDELIDAFNNSRSIAQILTILNLKAAGGNYKVIKFHLERLNLDVKKLSGQSWSNGIQFASKRDLNEYLVYGSRIGSFKLKKRLIKENIFKKQCSNCHLDKWMGNDIPLELDHINGINIDNRLENLRLLCPNCHALTSTYRGKNIIKS